MKSAEYEGLLVVDKPAGITSRAVVNHVLRWFPRKTSVGHTGTLDPLATGVLVLCIGKATRLAEYVQRMPKSYRAGIRLGARSDTDDADGAIQPSLSAGPPPEIEEVRRCLETFVGEIEQVPPVFSAVRIEGRRAYDLARKGKDVSLSPRRIVVYGIELLAYEYPHLDLQVRCGKGTYIRSLAREIGERLGCGGYVETLRRTLVGPFDAANAVALDIDADAAKACLLPLSAAVADLPKLTLDESEALRLCRGQAIALTGAHLEQKDQDVAVFDSAGSLIAVAFLDNDNVISPAKVLV